MNLLLTIIIIIIIIIIIVIIIITIVTMAFIIEDLISTQLSYVTSSRTTTTHTIEHIRQ